MRRLLKGFIRSESASPSDSQKTKRSRHHKSRQHRLRHHRHSKYFQNVAIIKGGPRARHRNNTVVVKSENKYTLNRALLVFCTKKVEGSLRYSRWIDEVFED